MVENDFLLNNLTFSSPVILFCATETLLAVADE